MTTLPIASPANSQFTRQFGVELPLGLREQAAAMTWEQFVATYSRAAGPVRLGRWCCADAPATGPQARRYTATIAVGDRIATATAAASGPVAALTAMLYDQGVPVEMVRFHQLRSGAHTATFICGSDGGREAWAMGWSTDPTQSALRAVVACANRLATP